MLRVAIYLAYLVYKKAPCIGMGNLTKDMTMIMTKVETWHRKGDRLKAIERAIEQTVPTESPYIIRLDGCSFHTFTRGMTRPFDMRLVSSMEETTKDLVLKVGATTGFTQSDEISLLFPACDILAGQTHLYNGRVQKLCSIVASYATLCFNKHLASHNWEASDGSQDLKGKVSTGAFFDARLMIVDRDQAADCFAWRQVFDCQRNAVMAVAQSHFSAKQLHKVNRERAVQMLSEIGVDVSDHSIYPAKCMYGCFVKRIKIQKTAFDPRKGEEVPCLRTEAFSFSQKDAMEAEDLFAKYGSIPACLITQ